MKIRDIMSEGVATTSENESIIRAAIKMAEENVGSLVVVEGGMVYGIITDRDIIVGCIAEAHDAGQCTVMQHMSAPVVTVGEDDDALQAAHLMTTKRVKRLPVVDRSRLVGLVSVADVAKSMERPLFDLLESIGLDVPKRPGSPAIR
ncbi:MAG: CBS domain-containing protein [SAR202 cluster bacterium]|nr:CBS domain-containing protein [SAR202 cluster bacterium]